MSEPDEFGIYDDQYNVKVTVSVVWNTRGDFPSGRQAIDMVVMALKHGADEGGLPHPTGIACCEANIRDAKWMRRIARREKRQAEKKA